MALALVACLLVQTVLPDRHRSVLPWELVLPNKYREIILLGMAILLLVGEEV